MAEPRNMPWGWFSPGHNLQLWGEGGTYTPVPYDALPPLPQRSGAPFAWLRAAPVPEDPLGVMDREGAPCAIEDLGPAIDTLAEEARRLGLVVPTALRTFMTDPELHGHVPTCTACYIDLPNRSITLPNGEPGRLLRFLNDQQCCLLWYVHLVPGGEHRIVCAEPVFGDEDEDESLEDIIRLGEAVICAPSFEDFIHRFWLENTLWYASQTGRTLSEEEQAYVRAAQQARSRQ